MYSTRSAFVTVILICVPSLAVAQAKDQKTEAYENVVTKMIALMDSIADALRTVKDESSAAKAKPRVLKSAKDFVELRKTAAKIKPPSADQRKALKKKYEAQIIKAQKSLFKEVARVRSLAAGRMLVAELSKLLTEKKPEKKK